MAQRCPHCGTANRAGSNFCNHCGADLRSEPPPPSAATAESTSGEANPGLPRPSEESAGTPPLAGDLAAEQPWLQPDPVDDEPGDGEGAGAPAPSRRLITNVQGLLDPVRVFSPATEKEATEEEAAALAPLAPALTLGSDQLRRFRLLMSEEPTLLALPRAPYWRWAPVLRLPAIFLLLGSLVLLGFFLSPTASETPTVQHWPGVDAAHALIESLPVGAPVLILWGYDPATAGEMDLLALPLATHLAARRSQSVVISLLPNGLATARRLFAQVAAADIEGRNLQLAVGDAQITAAAFLPGGAALPLVGQDLGASLAEQPTVGATGEFNAVKTPPVLVILLAAQAEAVQGWLEQAQPLNQLPVVAFTSAAADPLLRPYLESGQLRGLVSGFDGAWAYQQLSSSPLAAQNEARLSRQLPRQTWGHIALLLTILLGNLAALLGRESHG